jgi:hypothetical protein
MTNPEHLLSRLNIKQYTYAVYADGQFSALIGKIMKQLARAIAAVCVLSSISITPLTALSQAKPASQPYFNGYSTDGAPVRANSCGVNYEKKGWMVRDLGGGVRGEVGTIYEARKPLTVTLLFRFSDEQYGKFEIFPEEIRLYVHPSEKLVKPSSIERRPISPTDIRCDYLQRGEWITLKFPVQPEQAEQVALVFPRGSVSKGDPIDARPFRFERIDFSPEGTPSPSRPPVSAPVLPPVSPRFGSFESATAMPGNVKGAWIIDAKATEELITNIPRPAHADKLIQWFGLASGYMVLYTYEFDGNKAKASVYRGGKVLEFERVSNQDSETTYALIDAANSKTQNLSVSMLKNGNIRIVPSYGPEMAYLRWKPGQLKTETATADDVMAATRTWLTSVQAIVETLNPPPKPSVKTVADSQIALDEAVRMGVIRKATVEDVNAFRNAYIEKKYTSKNLPVPAKENALSVTSVDISRAYVVLKKFTYPSGMINENRVVFFIPKRVSAPSGAIGHSAIYDFETLTVGCTAARTGGIDC